MLTPDEVKFEDGTIMRISDFLLFLSSVFWIFMIIPIFSAIQNAWSWALCAINWPEWDKPAWENILENNSVNRLFVGSVMHSSEVSLPENLLVKIKCHSCVYFFIYCESSWLNWACLDKIYCRPFIAKILDCNLEPKINMSANNASTKNKFMPWDTKMNKIEHPCSEIATHPTPSKKNAILRSNLIKKRE